MICTYSSADKADRRQVCPSSKNNLVALLSERRQTAFVFSAAVTATSSVPRYYFVCRCFGVFVVATTATVFVVVAVFASVAILSK